MNNLYEQIERTVHRIHMQDTRPIIAQARLRDLNKEIRAGRLPDGSWIFQSRSAAEPIVTASADYARITLINANPEDQQTSRFLLRTAFECRFCHEGILSLHAACVEVDGCAIAFTGRSGLGKSTRARAWADVLGARWISGDRPAIRLGTDSAIACGVPWDGKEQVFRSVETPLKCIMEVRRSPANQIRRLGAEQARQLLMRQCLIPMWDTEAAAAAMVNIRRLLQITPVYRVFCGPEAEDARIIHDILINHPEQIREEATEMKIKDGFVLRNVVDEFIVMPAGDRIATFDGAVVLNEVSAFIYRQLEQPASRDDVLAAIMAEYEVDEATAAADLDTLLDSLETMGVLDR